MNDEKEALNSSPKPRWEQTYPLSDSLLPGVEIGAARDTDVDGSFRNWIFLRRGSRTAGLWCLFATAVLEESGKGKHAESVPEQPGGPLSNEDHFFALCSFVQYLAEAGLGKASRAEVAGDAPVGVTAVMQRRLLQALAELDLPRETIAALFMPAVKDILAAPLEWVKPRRRLLAPLLKAFAFMPGTAPGIVARIAPLLGTKARAKLARRATTQQVLEVLARDKNSRVLLEVGANSSVTAHALAALATSPDYVVRMQATRNPAMDARTLAQLARDPVGDVRVAAASNPKVPRDLRKQLAQDKAIKEETARDYRTVPWKLATLARDENSEVRRLTARNLKTPPMTLHALARDGNPDVRQEVAENSHATLDTLRQLATDDCWEVRKAVANNVATPPELLTQLATDPHIEVRIVIAEEVKTPPTVLERLASDANIQVRAAVAANQQTPSAVLERLASDPHKEVRRGVARNVGVGPEILKRLSQDAEEDVRKRAMQNYGFRFSYLEKRPKKTETRG